MTTTPSDVFVVYCEDDPDAVDWVENQLGPALKRSGLTFSTPQDFHIGISLIENQTQAVLNSRFAIVVFTPDCIEDDWREFDLILLQTLSVREKNARLLPVKLKPCELPPSVQGLTIADFTKPTEVTGTLRKLVDQIKSAARRNVSQVPVTAEFYASGSISDPKYFFGRETEIRRICRLLTRFPLQHSMVVGPKFSGKSSLLKHIMNIGSGHINLRSDPLHNTSMISGQHKWVYIDFHSGKVQSPQQLLQYILGSLEFEIPQQVDIVIFENILRERLHDPLVLLLDEIGIALRTYTELDDGRFWGNLKDIVSNSLHGQIGMVVSSVEKPHRLPPTIGHGSPFFGVFNQTITLRPFNHTEMEQLISSSPVTFTDSDIEWIISNSEGWPIVLQVLCRECMLAYEDKEHDLNWRENAISQISAIKRKIKEWENE